VVVFRDVATATSTNPYNGVPANGAALQWTETRWLRVKDGAIVEHWSDLDRLGLLQQLGAVPS
jgi:predicted ester cyclase